MPIHARPATYALAIAVGLFALTFTFQVTTRAQGPDARKGARSSASTHSAMSSCGPPCFACTR
jgi:hypothetical protein